MLIWAWHTEIIFRSTARFLLLSFAHTINWIAYGTRTTNSVMIQVHRELEEAGRVAGASSQRVLWKIVLPLIAAGVLNSWIWIGMLSYREVTMALDADDSGSNVVVSTVVWQFWGSGWVPEVSRARGDPDSFCGDRRRHGAFCCSRAIGEIGGAS